MKLTAGGKFYRGLTMRKWPSVTKAEFGCGTREIQSANPRWNAGLRDAGLGVRDGCW